MINRARLSLILGAGGVLMASAAASAAKADEGLETAQRDTCSADSAPKESRQVRRHRERQEAKRNRRTSK